MITVVGVAAEAKKIKWRIRGRVGELFGGTDLSMMPHISICRWL